MTYKQKSGLGKPQSLERRKGLTVTDEWTVRSRSSKEKPKDFKKEGKLHPKLLRGKIEDDRS